MARSRRLRKKLCVDEFQELGFEVQLNYRDGISDAERNAAMDDFLDQAIEANGWASLARMSTVMSAWAVVVR